MVIWYVLAAVGVVTVVGGVMMWRGATTERDNGDVLLGIGLPTAIVGAVLVLIVGWMAVMPSYRLWRASIEKRIAVEEALAERDAAVELAEAERIRAGGVAEANEIIAESIDEQYIRWLYVNNLADHNASEIIYIPTEGGLPILEAGRLGDGGPNE